MTVQFALESVSSLPWNHCPVCSGIRVQFGVEYARASWRPAICSTKQRVRSTRRVGVDTPGIGHPSLPWRSTRNGMASWPRSPLPARVCHWQPEFDR